MLRWIRTRTQRNNPWGRGCRGFTTDTRHVERGGIEHTYNLHYVETSIIYVVLRALSGYALNGSNERMSPEVAAEIAKIERLNHGVYTLTIGFESITVSTADLRDRPRMEEAWWNATSSILPAPRKDHLYKRWVEAILAKLRMREKPSGADPLIVAALDAAPISYTREDLGRGHVVVSLRRLLVSSPALGHTLRVNQETRHLTRSDIVATLRGLGWKQSTIWVDNVTLYVWARDMTEAEATRLLANAPPRARRRRKGRKETVGGPAAAPWELPADVLLTRGLISEGLLAAVRAGSLSAKEALELYADEKESEGPPEPTPGPQTEAESPMLEIE